MRTRDTYRRGQELLAAGLPHDFIHTVNGGRAYPTFLVLWRMFLDSDCYDNPAVADAAP